MTEKWEQQCTTDMMNIWIFMETCILLIVEEGISRPFYLLAVWIGLLASSRSDDESSLHCLAGLLVHPPNSIMTTGMIIIVMLMETALPRRSCWCFGWVWQILGRLWWNTESICGNFDGLSSIDAQEGILFGCFWIAKLAFNQKQIQMIFAESHCDNRYDKCYKLKYSHVISSPNLYLCYATYFVSIEFVI